MTVTYCGTCGTAHQAVARFCRHCGAELSQLSASFVETMPVDSINSHVTGISLPEAEIIPLTPVANFIEFAPEILEETDQATEALRLMREARIIEARQEEEARQFKKNAEQTLAHRLTKTTQSVKEAMVATTPAIPLISPRNLKNPLVPILPQQDEPICTPKAVAPPVAPKPEPICEPELTESPAIEIVRRYRGAALMPTNALQAVKEQSRSALAVRAAASMLGLTLLLGGIYAYRHPVFTGSLMGGVRNLLSPEEQSAQLLQASRTDLEAGKVEEATQKLERAVALSPNEPDTRQQLAAAYEQHGRTDDALTTLDGLLKLAPEHLDARLKLALLQQRKGNLQEARAQFQKIIQLDQSSSQAVQALNAIETIDEALNAAALARNNNDSVRARRDNQVKRNGPVLPVIAAARLALPLTGRPTTVLNGGNNGYVDWSLRRSFETTPDPLLVARMHKETGVRYSQIREFNAALREFQEAVRLTPNDKDLYYFLGSTYRGLGQPLKAFDHYKRCDSGPYASTAQSGAQQIEKAARKEYDKLQQARLEAGKNQPRNGGGKNGLQNLSAPIIAPFGERSGFQATSKD